MSVKASASRLPTCGTATAWKVARCETQVRREVVSATVATLLARAAAQREASLDIPPYRLSIRSP